MKLWSIFMEAAVAAFNVELEARRAEQFARRELARLLRVQERDLTHRFLLRVIEDLVDDASERDVKPERADTPLGVN